MTMQQVVKYFKSRWATVGALMVALISAGGYLYDHGVMAGGRGALYADMQDHLITDEAFSKQITHRVEVLEGQGQVLGIVHQQVESAHVKLDGLNTRMARIEGKLDMLTPPKNSTALGP